MAFPDIPFRVRIGVTGHRALQEPERIAAAIRGVLDTGIWELFDPPVLLENRSTRLAFTVLTPLAEGADRLVAKEILNSPDAVIEVVLPFAEDDYLSDFAEAASKAEFEELCRKARRVTVLKPLAPSATGAGAVPEEERKRAYERVGRHVADHCDVLIAVWDGRPSRGRGGTAEIVEYARRKRLPLIIVSSADPGQLTVEKGQGLSGRAYGRIGLFNRFSGPGAEQKAYVNKMYEGLFAVPEAEKLSASVKAKIRERLIPWYVRASLIAKRNQKRYFRSGLTVYALSPWPSPPRPRGF